jgi:hypothetical protein
MKLHFSRLGRGSWSLRGAPWIRLVSGVLKDPARDPKFLTDKDGPSELFAVVHAFDVLDLSGDYEEGAIKTLFALLEGLSIRGCRLVAIRYPTGIERIVRNVLEVDPFYRVARAAKVAGILHEAPMFRVNLLEYIAWTFDIDDVRRRMRDAERARREWFAERYAKQIKRRSR